MALHLLRHYFCCCSLYDKQEEGEEYDETTHLIIPETAEPSLNFADDFLANQRRLRERLTEIVRSKEGKMVNVASHIPFNLHNQVLPKAQSHSSSRSASESYNDLYYHDAYHPYSDFFATSRDLAKFRKQRSKYDHGLGRLRSISPSDMHRPDGAGPSASIRTRSPSAEAAPTPAKLLNLRLVGYTDTRVRGRTRERGSHPTGLPSKKKSSGGSGGGSGGEAEGFLEGEADLDSPTTPSAAAGSHAVRRPVNYDLQLPDTSAMIISWGD